MLQKIFHRKREASSSIDIILVQHGSNDLGVEKEIRIVGLKNIIYKVWTLDDLYKICEFTHYEAQVIAICTDVIIPADIIDNLERTPYNIHPGPPEYPGRYPSAWALYDKAKKFGTTLHIVDKKVDSGHIITAEYFPIPEGATRSLLDMYSLQSVLNIVRQTITAMVSPSEVLAISDTLTWADKPRTTARSLIKLCHVPRNCSKEEFELRYKAVGKSKNYPLNITMFGHKFILNDDYVYTESEKEPSQYGS